MTNGVFIDPRVDPARIAPDAVLYPGCRILGEQTSIGPGSVLGAEAPVTLENCQLGRGVKLGGGFFSGAVFLDGSGMGSGAHVRAGTILEEEANGAHTVGLKQTVLLPFVTLGSLINFCDLLMAGGTSRKDHSEVGSSYIHFNFTPHQDKATASLIGDVPRGALLNQRPIFLGGQGGLVGPARVAFGSVVAAGGICRKDVLKENHLHVPTAPSGQTVPYEQGVYKSIDRIVKNNLLYIGNIRALKAWYEQVRIHFIRDAFDRACHEGALRNLDLILNERILRLEQFAGKLERSAAILDAQSGSSADCGGRQREFSMAWKSLRAQLESLTIPPADARLGSEIASSTDSMDYLNAIRSLSKDAQAGATQWLQGLVDETARLYP